MPAFQEAVRLGADYIEVDVRTTADGKLVLSHDSTVDRCTDGHGEVAKMTFEQIRALDAGSKKGLEFAGTKVPTFDEVLDYARGKINIYVDVKQVGERPGRPHRRARNGRTRGDLLGPSLAGDSGDQSHAKIMPESVNAAVVERIIGELHPKVIAFGASDWKPEVIKLAKESGAELYVDRQGGTTDNPEGWQAAIDAGADGIQTDRPGDVKYFPN